MRKTAMRTAALRTMRRACAAIQRAADGAPGSGRAHAIVLVAALFVGERSPIPPRPPAPRPVIEREQAEPRDLRAAWRATSDLALWASISRGRIAVVGLRAPG